MNDHLLHEALKRAHAAKNWAAHRYLVRSLARYEVLTDEIRNAAVRLRAIYHNRPVRMDGMPNTGDYDTALYDERKAIADQDLEKALFADGMMDYDIAIERIESLHEQRIVRVTFDNSETIDINV